MKLVGANWGFIRRPFLRRNIWSGIIAGLMADGILMGTAYMLVTYEPELIRIITPEVMLSICAFIRYNNNVPLCLCFHQQIFENESQHIILYINTLII